MPGFFKKSVYPCNITLPSGIEIYQITLEYIYDDVHTAVINNLIQDEASYCCANYKQGKNNRITSLTSKLELDGYYWIYSKGEALAFFDPRTERWCERSGSVNLKEENSASRLMGYLEAFAS